MKQTLLHLVYELWISSSHSLPMPIHSDAQQGITKRSLPSYNLLFTFLHLDEQHQHKHQIVGSQQRDLIENKEIERPFVGFVQPGI